MEPEDLATQIQTILDQEYPGLPEGAVQVFYDPDEDNVQLSTDDGCTIIIPAADEDAALRRARSFLRQEWEFLTNA